MGFIVTVPGHPDFVDFNLPLPSKFIPCLFRRTTMKEVGIGKLHGKGRNGAKSAHLCPVGEAKEVQELIQRYHADLSLNTFPGRLKLIYMH